ncbi:MAG: alginate lyase family protein [Gammaproteobacteria bacterium]|nr:alginate lyase family protein [Gammaproteobacteria bacterium]
MKQLPLQCITGWCDQRPGRLILGCCVALLIVTACSDATDQAPEQQTLQAALVDSTVTPEPHVNELETQPPEKLTEQITGTATELTQGQSNNPEPRDGLINSRSDLRDLAAQYRAGNQPMLDNTEQLLAVANKEWSFPTLTTEFAGTSAQGSVYDKSCSPVNQPAEGGFLPDMGQHLYAKVLAYWFTDDELYAESARRILVELAASSGYREVAGEVTYSAANQCALELSWLVPLVIETALLIEGWDGWNSLDRQAMESWLANTVYPVTAAISRTRKNNWGAAAAFASWSIAHYLQSSRLPLVEIFPVEQVLEPADASQQHIDQQLAIMGNDWEGDSRCDQYGIQNHGGIPDELRRGSAGCDGTALLEADRALDYQITHAGSLVFHAEALSRHGNNELYDYTLPNGFPAVLQTVLFVVDNPTGTSFDWKPANLGVLRLLNARYNSGVLCEQLGKGRYFAEGRYLPYTRLTHPDSCL